MTLARLGGRTDSRARRSEHQVWNVGERQQPGGVDRDASITQSRARRVDVPWLSQAQRGGRRLQPRRHCFVRHRFLTDSCPPILRVAFIRRGVGRVGRGKS